MARFLRHLGPGRLPEVANTVADIGRPVVISDMTVSACRGRTKTMESSGLDVQVAFVVRHADRLVNCT